MSEVDQSLLLPLKRITIQNIRNIQHAEIQQLEQVNIFFGENGSGKTSVLEALAFLPTARSFRHANIRRFISYEADQCLVFGVNDSEDHPIKLGVSRHKDGSKQIKSKGELLTKLVDLAEILPFQLIFHKTFQILSEGPSVRRQLMDWGVFHVEHDFKSLWLRLQRATKQRNKLLRLEHPKNEELSPWSNELIELAVHLDEKRRSYITELQPLFLQYVAMFLPDLEGDKIDFAYYAGWPKSADYQQVLNDALEKDIQKGFTQYGPHRASINITINGIPVSDVLSRGQLKAVLIAFKLAQGELLYQKQQVPAVYLLDDLPSELDEKHLSSVCEALNQTRSQIFITCIEKSAVTGFFNSDKCRLFHVEHGKITPL